MSQRDPENDEFPSTNDQLMTEMQKHASWRQGRQIRFGHWERVRLARGVWRPAKHTFP
jgi:hypothetical protein